MRRAERHRASMMLKILTVIACVITPRIVVAGCCEIRRVEANPPSATLRVCDSAVSSDCEAPLFEGSVAYGTPQPICSTADILSYRELDETTARGVLDLLREKGADDVAVFGGGIIPPEDIGALKAIGVKAIFTPGTSTQDIVRFVRENIRAAV